MSQNEIRIFYYINAFYIIMNIRILLIASFTHIDFSLRFVTNCCKEIKSKQALFKNTGIFQNVNSGNISSKLMEIRKFCKRKNCQYEDVQAQNMLT